MAPASYNEDSLANYPPNLGESSDDTEQSDDSSGYRSMLSVSPDTEPLTLKEALASNDADKWKMAMQDELDSLHHNNTWELTELPHGRKAIGSKWIFRIKRDEHGNVERYKARLVAQGFSQLYGIDYQETFSPVVRYASIRILIALATQYDYEIHQMDVTTAYLNGELEEEIFMKQPEGFQQGNLVCRLNKSLYGLKQSGRAWYSVIDAFLISLKFKRNDADHGVYSRYTNNSIIYITLYVDDLIIIGNSMPAVNQIKLELSSKFKMKDLGELHYILGIQVTRNRKQGTTTLSQHKYIEDILARYNMTNAKPVGAPLDTSVKLTKNPVHHKRTKHIDIKYHYVRDAISNKQIDIIYCPTEDNIADVLTKGLSKQKHLPLTKQLGLLDPQDRFE
jgi:hypothetical protein